MKKKMLQKIAMLLAAVLLLVGCAQTATQTDTSSTSETTADTGTESSTDAQTDTGTTVQQPENVTAKKLVMGSTGPATNTGTGSSRAVYAFIDAVSEISGGRLEIEYVGGGVLGSTAQHYSQLTQGTLDMFISGLDTVTILQGCDDFSVCYMPYVFDDTNHLRNFIASDEFAEMCASLRDNNRILFTGVLCYQLPRILTTTNTPVVTPADLSNLKVRVPESPIQTAIWTAWGANPVQIPASDLYTSLDTGVCDGQDNDVVSSTALSLHEVQHYYMELNYIQQLLGIYFSEQSWEALSEEEQGWITEALAQAEEIGTAGYLEDYAKVKAAAEAAGVTFVEADIDAFRAISEEVAMQFDGDTFRAGLYETIRNMK